MIAYSILIADDDLDDQLLLGEAFNEIKYGGHIDFVDNGHAVLEFLSGKKGYAGNLPEMIILDLNMPLKNGQEVLKELKSNELYRHIPVIIFSTNSGQHIIQECYSLGADLYIKKPTTYSHILEFASYIQSSLVPGTA